MIGINGTLIVDQTIQLAVLHQRPYLSEYHSVIALRQRVECAGISPVLPLELRTRLHVVQQTAAK